MWRSRIRTLMIAVAMVSIGLGVARRPRPLSAVQATSRDPKIAVRQEKLLDGVLWGLSYDAAREQAESEGRPVLIHFDSINAVNSRRMVVQVLRRDDIVPRLSRFVTVRLYIDDVPIRSLASTDREVLAEQNSNLQFKLAAECGTPYVLVLSEQGQPLAAMGGVVGPAELAAFLDRALAKHW